MEKTLKYISIIGAVAIVLLIAILSAKNMLINTGVTGGDGGAGGAAGYATMSSSRIQDTSSQPAPSTGVQYATLKANGLTYYTEPATLQAGVPVRMSVDLQSVRGCLRSVVIPAMGVHKYVSQEDNIIEFTPTQTGTYPVTCSMNMGRGSITITSGTSIGGTSIPASSQDSSSQQYMPASAPLFGNGNDNSGSCAMGTNKGCGCAMMG